MESLSDNALMLKVKEGDLDKLGLLFERYKKQLFMFFYRMSNDENLSEDLVQNVFIRIIKYGKTFTGKGAFKVWLFHIARNVIYDHYRKNKTGINESLEQKHDELSQHREEELSRQKNENLGLLKMAIDRLDKEKREIIMLSKIEGIKYKEIGELINCSEGTVKARVFRALIVLKKEFDKLEKSYG